MCVRKGIVLEAMQASMRSSFESYSLTIRFLGPHNVIIVILINNFPVNVFSHFPYCVNLAGSIGNKYLAWSDEKNSESVLLASLKSIEYELGTLAKFDKVKNGVVIHPGNWFDRKEGLLAIAKSINRINFPVNSTLLLENSAGQGNSLASKQSCIGICIDTCHLFAYGDYDFRDIKEIDRFLKDFDTLFGRSKLKSIHLNDSTKPLKSKKDNHAFIGTGCIWKDNLSSLVYLLNKTKGIPIVLETSPSDMEIIENLNKI